MLKFSSICQKGACPRRRCQMLKSSFTLRTAADLLCCKAEEEVVYKPPCKLPRRAGLFLYKGLCSRHLVQIKIIEQSKPDQNFLTKIRLYLNSEICNTLSDTKSKT